MGTTKVLACLTVQHIVGDMYRCYVQEFPGEGLGKVVHNVFDFDSYHPELLDLVVKTLHKHGIPIGASSTNVTLAPE